MEQQEQEHEEIEIESSPTATKRTIDASKSTDESGEKEKEKEKELPPKKRGKVLEELPLGWLTAKDYIAAANQIRICNLYNDSLF